MQRSDHQFCISSYQTAESMGLLCLDFIVEVRSQKQYLISIYIYISIHTAWGQMIQYGLAYRNTVCNYYRYTYTYWISACMSPFLGLRISNKGTKKLRIIYTGWSKLHLLLSRQHRTCCKTAKPIFQAAFRMRGLYLLFPVIAHKINAALVTSFGRTQKASKPSRFTTVRRLINII